MRQRVEDLGRLSVMLEQILEHELFKKDSLPGRPKDYWEWFHHLSDETKEDVLNKWVYGIQSLKEDIYEMLSIANGTDLLNEAESEH